MCFIGAGVYFFITVPLCKAWDAKTKRDYGKRKDSILSREYPHWRQKLYLLNKEDRLKVAAALEEQEHQARAMVPHTKEEIEAELEFRRQTKELYRKNGWGEPPLPSFDVYPGPSQRKT